MTTGDFALLVNAIKTKWFTQPITVRALSGGQYEILDGHHRWEAAKVAGYTQVPALVYDDMSDDDATAIALGNNRMRGQLDLTMASQDLRDLAANGYTDLTLSGFDGADITSLLEQLPDVTEALDNLDVGDTDDVDLPQVQQNKRFAVRLVYDAVDDRDLIRSVALRFGNTVEEGVLYILREVNGQ